MHVSTAACCTPVPWVCLRRYVLQNLNATTGARKFLLAKHFGRTIITKGSVSYLSSPCFSTIIGGIGGPARANRGILDDINYKGSPPREMDC